MEPQVPMDGDKSNEEEVEAPSLKGAVDVAKAQQPKVCLDKEEIQKNVIDYLLDHSQNRDAVNKTPVYTDRLPNFVTTLLSTTDKTTVFQFIFSTTITRFAMLAPKVEWDSSQEILWFQLATKAYSEFQAAQLTETENTKDASKLRGGSWDFEQDPDGNTALQVYNRLLGMTNLSLTWAFLCNPNSRR
eukprot:g45708.t1